MESEHKHVGYEKDSRDLFRIASFSDSLNTSSHKDSVRTADPCENPDLSIRGAMLPGLDGLRGIAALGVVLLHSCVPYMQPAVPGLAWSVNDRPHWLASQCFWLIELFVMPVFLVLAGYFAWRSLTRSGVAELIRSRARRLLVPLGFGAVVVLPADLYIWLTGWVADSKIPLRKMQSLKFSDGIDQDLWGLSHLWFLQYLFLYILVLGSVYWGLQRSSFLRRMLHSSRFCFASLFSAAWLTLIFAPEVVWGFQHSFYPVASKWIYSGAFFALGIWVAYFDSEMQWLTTTRFRHASFAVALSLPAMLLGQWHLRGGDQQVASLLLAVTTTASATLITLASMGYAASIKRPLSERWSYLAASSFWIYLVHHPILGLLQIDMKWMMPEISSIIKVLLGMLVSVALSLATYEIVVRKTALGRLLGFQYSPRKPEADLADRHVGDDVLEGSLQQNIITIVSQDDKDLDDASEKLSDRKAA